MNEKDNIILNIPFSVLCVNKLFSHFFCACVYCPCYTLFLNNRRDFTQMGQTAFKLLVLSML